MSETISKLQFVEFNEQVYFGPEHGYTKILRLDFESAMDAPYADVVTADACGIEFLGKDCKITVPNSNIRFIYGTRVFPFEEQEPETVEAPAPKRRGRPPKAKA